MHQSAQSRFALDDTVRHSHLAAESRQEHDQLEQNIKVKNVLIDYIRNIHNKADLRFSQALYFVVAAQG